MSSSTAQNDEVPAPSAPAITTAQLDARTEPEKAQTLDELITSANLQYSLKNYDAAAEVYSKATERQAAENGEMEPENAELLFLYGRCLYKVAVARSDVLGGQVAGEAPPKRGDQGSSREAGAGDAKAGSQGKAPFIAVSGVDTDSEDEEDEDDGEPGEEEDDFATAYEVLDLSRVLFEKKLALLSRTDALETIDSKGKGKAADKTDAPLLMPELRHVKDRLADTHDLQAEISLENERFGDAVTDGQANLALRLEIESPDSELIAEAYYKVALAQEFTFFTAVREAKEAQQQANGTSSGRAGAVEPETLYEAIENLVKAIESCELRVKNEQTALASLSPQDASAKRLKIADVKEIVQDMNTRLADLHTTAKSLGPTLAPHLTPSTLARLENLQPVAPEAPAQAAATARDGAATSGTLAEMPGESAAERQARIHKAAQGATDISGLVRQRKKQKPAPAVEDRAANGEGVGAVNGKRKLEDDDVGSEKRVRFDG